MTQPLPPVKFIEGVKFIKGVHRVDVAYRFCG